MRMLKDDEVTAADLTDWRKLGQGIHARFEAADFTGSAAFVGAVSAAAGEVGHAPSVAIHGGVVDLKLISEDAVYRDPGGVEHRVDWVTERDLALARRISGIAAAQGLRSDPSAITTIELALDTSRAATLAPVWAALLTGGIEAVGRGSVGDDVRDATARVPILWFQETEEHETPRQRFHLDVWVAPEVADERIAAAVAAGGVIADDSQAPSYTVVADQDGNQACVCAVRASG